MIVAYARPFSPGRAISVFRPDYFNISHPRPPYTTDRLLALRHEAYAHSDAKRYMVRPFKGDLIRSIENIIDVYFSPAEIDIFLGMTVGLLTRTDERMEQLRKGDLDTNASA
jgi:hypothetical protein